MKKTALSSILVAAVVLSACGSSPTSSLYTLEVQARDAVRTPGAPASPRIEVVSVRIPDLWDRPQMVTARPGGQVDFNEFHRWAVPLKSEVPRIFTRNLARLAGVQSVWLRDDFPGGKPDYRVFVSIDQIEAVAGQHLLMEATWAVRGAEAGAQLKIGRATLKEPVPDGSYAAIAAAASRTMLALSESVARDIESIPRR